MWKAYREKIKPIVIWIKREVEQVGWTKILEKMTVEQAGWTMSLEKIMDRMSENNSELKSLVETLENKYFHN